MRDKLAPLTRDIAIIKQQLNDLTVDLNYAMFEQTGKAQEIMEQIHSLRAERERLYDIRNGKVS